VKPSLAAVRFGSWRLPSMGRPGSPPKYRGPDSWPWRDGGGNRQFTHERPKNRDLERAL